MKVAGILAHKGADVRLAPSSTKLVELAKMMHDEKIGSVIICNDGVKPEGIVTERDVLNAIIDHGPGVLDREAGNIVDHDVATCSPEDNVVKVMAAMTDRRTRHVLVLDNGGISGIVSIGDVVKSRMDELEVEVDAMRDYVAGNA